MKPSEAFQSDLGKNYLQTTITYTSSSQIDKMLSKKLKIKQAKRRLSSENQSAFSKAKVAARSPDQILSLFLQHSSFLMPSDAYGVNFSLESCLSRMEKGYKMTEFENCSSSTRRVSFSVSNDQIVLDGKSMFSVRDLKGFLIGACSSRFSKHKDFALCGLQYDQCFSLITHLRTYDFASQSATARYDFLISMSWLIHTKSKSSTVIPLSKKDVVLYTVKHKIRQMAANLNVNVAEFIMVITIQMGMIKHFRQIRDSKKELAILNILRNKLRISSRIFKICRCFREIKQSNKKTLEIQRIALLNGKRINQLKNIKQGNIFLETPKKGLNRLQTKILSYLIPSIKSVFQNSRNEEKGVKDFRRQLTDSSVRNSVQY